MNQMGKVARANCRGSWVLGSACGKCPRCEETRPAIAAMPVQVEPVAKRWQLGDKVKKKANSSWRGVVCGFYNTAATPNGYSVVSLYEPGSVQVWPEAALEDWDGVMAEDELRAEITRLTEALRDIVGVFTDPEAGEVDRNLAIRDARQALAGVKPC